MNAKILELVELIIADQNAIIQEIQILNPFIDDRFRRLEKYDKLLEIRELLKLDVEPK